jgi:AcrR family transcriptional regulator
MAKKRAPRTRLDVDERRSQLLELGLELFGETNYDDIAIDDIAARASISKGLLYHYFGSKRGYYVATIRHAAAKLLAMLEPDPALSEEQRADEGIANYLMFVEARASAYLALMRSGIGTDPEVLGILDEAREVIVRRILVDGVGVESPTPLQRLALRGWVGSVEAVALDWLERRQVSRERVVNLLRAGLWATVASLAGQDAVQR